MFKDCAGAQNNKCGSQNDQRPRFEQSSCLLFHEGSRGAHHHINLPYPTFDSSQFVDRLRQMRRQPVANIT
jgi:hypothetical protein